MNHDCLVIAVSTPRQNICASPPARCAPLPARWMVCRPQLAPPGFDPDARLSRRDATCAGGGGYLPPPRPSVPASPCEIMLGGTERRVMAAIEACRTPALGGHVERCADCGFVRCALQLLPQSALPVCQGLAARSGWSNNRRRCCRCPTSTSCSRCRLRSRTSRSTTRRSVYHHPVSRRGRGAAQRRSRHSMISAHEIGAIAVLHSWGQALHPEPSLMIPGIINPCIFSEQGKLFLRAALLQS